MATKSKLEKAVEARAAAFNDAQREVLMSQFSAYKANKSRMAAVADRLRMLDAQTGRQGDRAALVDEYTRLASVNNEIAASLFSQLDGGTL